MKAYYKILCFFLIALTGLTQSIIAQSGETDSTANTASAELPEEDFDPPPPVVAPTSFGSGTVTDIPAEDGENLAESIGAGVALDEAIPPVITKMIDAVIRAGNSRFKYKIPSIKNIREFRTKLKVVALCSEIIAQT